MQVFPTNPAAEAKSGWPRALAAAPAILAATPLSLMEGHGGNLLLSLPYYLAVMLTGFAPWPLYLPAGRGGGPMR